MTTAGAQLRALIEAPEIAVLPGVHDSLSALVAQSCGAQAIAAGGYAQRRPCSGGQTAHNCR